MKPDITLIFPSSPFLLDQAVFPPLGILYLSAYLKDHGFKVQCLDFGIGHTKDMAEADIIGISLTTPQRQEAFELAEYYKAQGKTTIAGGAHATHMPEECREVFDWVVIGEGESRLLDIMNILKGDPEATYIPDDPPYIDDCPFPDREALPIKDYRYEIDGVPATVLMTSRGCPYNCSFCAKVSRSFRMQSAERTVREIMATNLYGFEAFMIFDDVFIANKQRLQKMANMLSALRFKFRCFARTNLIDASIVKALKRMGVVEVGLGIESGSDDILRRNLKNTTRDMNTKAVKLLHRYGIRAKAFLIVGLPGETVETVEQTESWIKEACPDDIDVSIFQPLPGSAIFAAPDLFGINFQYDGKPGWYKGTPGEYEATISTDHLTSGQLVSFRDELEGRHKPKELLR